MADVVRLEPAERFKGVLIVGDVHGHKDLLEPMLVYARQRRLFTLSVGDLVDRGPDSVGCLRAFRSLEAAGAGLWLRGNHEDKIYRALLGRPVTLSEAVERTLAQFAALPAGDDLQNWFMNAYARAPYVARFGRIVVAHGGFARSMLSPGDLRASLRARALFGQPGRQAREDGKPVRVYDWVEEIPAGITVIIGHDPISRDRLLTRENDLGGRMIHLDSAAGKGEALSAVEIDRTGRIERALQQAPGADDLALIGFQEITPAAFPHAT